MCTLTRSGWAYQPWTWLHRSVPCGAVIRHRAGSPWFWPAPLRGEELGSGEPGPAIAAFFISALLLTYKPSELSIFQLSYAKKTQFCYLGCFFPLFPKPSFPFCWSAIIFAMIVARSTSQFALHSIFLLLFPASALSLIPASPQLCPPPRSGAGK